MTSLFSGNRRYLALWFPFLPTDRLKRQAGGAPDERPLVILAKVKSALRIVHADRKALEMGLAPGLTLADARARVPDLVIADEDRDADQALLRHIADWCDRFTPLVGLDGEEGIMLDITGCVHLFGGEEAMRAEVMTRLGFMGFTVQAAIAGTPDAARAVARYTKLGIVTVGKEADAVRPLPVAALGIDGERVLALSRAGLKTIADVADRPRAPLAARFGADLMDRLSRMRLAMVAAKFTPEEANQLRRAMATFRNVGTIGEFERMMVDRMTARGYDPDLARRCYEQIKGFGSYGFPESHAAAFAHLVYISSWIKCHHPAVFACSLLNSQPMGFYAPAQIVRDAREHGVEVRPADINMSHWDNTLEPAANGMLALRLGLRQIDGIREELGQQLAEHRGAGYPDIETLARRGALPRAMLERLADADAFRSIGLDRRNALWIVRRMPDDRPLPLFAAADAAELADEPDARLPTLSLSQHVVTDYQTTRLSLKAHPLIFLRERYRSEGVRSCAETAALKDGSWTRTIGVVLVRQRPGNGKVVFMTIEDDTGITNVVIWASLFQQFRRQVMGSRLIEARGRVQKSPEGIVHLVAQKLIDRSADLKLLSADAIPPTQHHRASNHPRDVRIIPKSRDFH